MVMRPHLLVMGSSWGCRSSILIYTAFCSLCPGRLVKIKADTDAIRCVDRYYGYEHVRDDGAFSTWSFVGASGTGLGEAPLMRRGIALVQLEVNDAPEHC